jgi:hypothetical protein
MYYALRHKITGKFLRGAKFWTWTNKPQCAAWHEDTFVHSLYCEEAGIPKDEVEFVEAQFDRVKLDKFAVIWGLKRFDIDWKPLTKKETEKVI